MTEIVQEDIQIPDLLDKDFKTTTVLNMLKKTKGKHTELRKIRSITYEQNRNTLKIQKLKSEQSLREVWDTIEQTRKCSYETNRR